MCAFDDTPKPLIFNVLDEYTMTELYTLRDEEVRLERELAILLDAASHRQLIQQARVARGEVADAESDRALKDKETEAIELVRSLAVVSSRFYQLFISQTLKRNLPFDNEIQPLIAAIAANTYGDANETPAYIAAREVLDNHSPLLAQGPQSPARTIREKVRSIIWEKALAELKRDGRYTDLLEHIEAVLLEMTNNFERRYARHLRGESGSSGK